MCLLGDERKGHSKMKTEIEPYIELSFLCIWFYFPYLKLVVINCYKSRNFQFRNKHYCIFKSVKQNYLIFIFLIEFQDCLKLLQECLCSRAPDLVCIGLQICKELFSRKNSVHEFMVSQLGTSVLAALKVLQTEGIYSEIYNQCVHEFFSVCIKLAKILSINKGQKESQLVLQQVLKADEVWNRILFQDGVKVYAKRKLIHFICFSIKSCDWTDDYSLSKDIYCMAVSIFHKLCSSDILKILKKRGQTAFVGICISDGDKQDEGKCWDTVHVREWTFLCFCVSAILARKQGKNIVSVSFTLLNPV